MADIDMKIEELVRRGADKDQLDICRQCMSDALLPRHAAEFFPQILALVERRVELIEKRGGSKADIYDAVDTEIRTATNPLANLKRLRELDPFIYNREIVSVYRPYLRVTAEESGMPQQTMPKARLRSSETAHDRR